MDSSKISQKLKSILYILGSIVAHILFMQLLVQWGSSSNRPWTEHPTSKQKINIQILETKKEKVQKKPKNISPPEPPKKLVESTLKTTLKKHKLLKPDFSDTAKEKTSNFSLNADKNLRPNTFFKSETGNGILQQFRSLTAARQQDVAFNYDLIGKKIEIPLTLMDQLKKGKAFATVELLDGELYLTLSGEPYLRAILYDSLRLKKQRKTILAIMKSLDRNRIRVSLSIVEQRFNTRKSDLPYSQQVKLTDKGIQIKTILNQTLKVKSGIALSDELAEKRRKWEMLKIEKLRNNKAYRRRIKRVPYL